MLPRIARTCPRRWLELNIPVRLGRGTACWTTLQRPMDFLEIEAALRRGRKQVTVVSFLLLEIVMAAVGSARSH